MKRILIIFIILLSLICFANENHNGRYLYRNDFYYYDINTFEVDSLNNIFKIDIIHDIHHIGQNRFKLIKSPYDNNYIQYIVFNTKYNPKTNTFNINYKGFVSGSWIKSGMMYLFSDAKIYYDSDSKLVPYNKKIIKIFKKYANSGNYYHYTNYSNDIAEIYEAYKNKSLHKLDALYDTINTANN